MYPAGLFLGDSKTKLLSIPVNDDGGKQIQPRDTEVLPFDRTVADFPFTGG